MGETDKRINHNLKRLTGVQNVFAHKLMDERLKDARGLRGVTAKERSRLMEVGKVVASLVADAAILAKQYHLKKTKWNRYFHKAQARYAQEVSMIGREHSRII